MDGRVVTKKFTVDFKHEMMEHPAALARFFREKESETVVLAEGAESLLKEQFHLLPVSQRNFLAVQWYNYWKRIFCEVELIENRETFYGYCRDQLRYQPRTPTADEVLNLPVVQQICHRFFS
jgi:hypothetical protein